MGFFDMTASVLSGLRNLWRSGDDSGGEPDDQSPERESHLVIGYRLCRRGFVDDNGWEKITEFYVDDPFDHRRPPVTREEVRERLGHKLAPGHYKLFPIDNNRRLMAAEWSLTVGSKERVESQGRQDTSDDEIDDSGGFQITPAQFQQMQEAYEQVDWDDRPDQ